MDEQSQFPVAGIPHYSTVPSFQYSKPEPIVQNEANSPRGGRDGQGPAGWHGTGPQGQNVRNKPNSRQSGMKGKYLMGKEL